MSNPTFPEFYKSLLQLVKTFEEKNMMLKVEEDAALNIIRIFGENADSVSRAKSGLEDVVELAYATAEHHPYWHYFTILHLFPKQCWKNGAMICLKKILAKFSGWFLNCKTRAIN